MSELFLDAISQSGTALAARTEIQSDRWTMIIAAADGEVGDMTIWDDGNELTVDIGQKYHSRFCPLTQDGSSELERRKNAAKSALDFVEQTLNDSVNFRIEYANGHCKSASCWTTNCGDHGPSPQTDAFLAFKWSGVTERFGT